MRAQHSTDQPTSRLEGSGEWLDPDVISGWAWDPEAPDTPVAVDIWCDEDHLGTVPADQFRQDLADAGKGDGRHAFSVALPDQVRDGRPHLIHACFGGTRRQLQNSPRGIGEFGLPVPRGELYARPPRIEPIESCTFYHTMDLPGVGTVRGEWDLRGNEDQYLGNVDLHQKRVLEIGKASGFLTFHMEARGAEVVAYDLSEFHSWDLVPYSTIDTKAFMNETRAHVWKVNNGFWLARQALGRQARLVLGSVYNVPREIGSVDVAVLAAVLLHVRDPLLALENALRLTRKTAIIVERLPDESDPKLPWARFLPDARTAEPPTTWWDLPPALMRRMLDVLGFEVTAETHHAQSYSGDIAVPLYTLVARRRP